jgi:hypothetical protein
MYSGTIDQEFDGFLVMKDKDVIGTVWYLPDNKQ